MNAAEDHRKIKVGESNELHDYRATAARDVRHLPLRLQGPMFAHIIRADVGGDLRRYTWQRAAEYSAVFGPRYKLPVATARQLRDNSPELQTMGLISYDLDEDDYIDKHGKPRVNRYNTFEVNRNALKMYAIEAERLEAEKAAGRARQKARYEAANREKRNAAKRAARAGVPTGIPAPEPAPQPSDKSYPSGIGTRSQGNCLSSDDYSSSGLRPAAGDDETIVVDDGKDFVQGTPGAAGQAHRSLSRPGPSSGTRSKTSGSTRPAESRPADEFDALAADVCSDRMWTASQARMFRSVGEDLGVSASLLEQVLDWWASGWAPRTFRHPDRTDSFGAYISSSRADLDPVMLNLTRAYVAARNKMAAELGVGPGTFDLTGWLEQQEQPDELPAGDSSHDEPELPAWLLLPAEEPAPDPRTWFCWFRNQNGHPMYTGETAATAGKPEGMKRGRCEVWFWEPEDKHRERLAKEAEYGCTHDDVPVLGDEIRRSVGLDSDTEARQRAAMEREAAGRQAEHDRLVRNERRQPLLEAAQG